MQPWSMITFFVCLASLSYYTVLKKSYESTVHSIWMWTPSIWRWTPAPLHFRFIVIFLFSNPVYLFTKPTSRNNVLLSEKLSTALYYPAGWLLYFSWQTTRAEIRNSNEKFHIQDLLCICANWAACPHSSRQCSMFPVCEDVLLWSFKHLHVLQFWVVFITANGMEVSLICHHNVSSPQSESFLGSEPTVPPIHLHLTQPTKTSDKHTDTFSAALQSACIQSVFSHKQQRCETDTNTHAHTHNHPIITMSIPSTQAKWNVGKLPLIIGIFCWANRLWERDKNDLRLSVCDIICKVMYIKLEFLALAIWGDLKCIKKSFVSTHKHTHNTSNILLLTRDFNLLISCWGSHNLTWFSIKQIKSQYEAENKCSDWQVKINI